MLIVLVVYWVGIFILTHMPGQHITFFTARLTFFDKILHFIAYFILSLLLWTVLNPARKVDWKKARVWWILVVIVLYGVFDEWLQAYTQRSCSFYDFLADVAGAAAALILLSIFYLPRISEHKESDNARS